MALTIIRAPDAASYPQFYGEDGNVFWLQWRNLGLHSLWTPVAGYQFLFARLAAAFASALPYDFQPAVFLVLALFASAWSAATIATATLPRGLGIALALALLLVPHDGEVWASVVNVQWIMACALPLIAVTRSPSGPVARVNQLVFLFVAGLSGPFTTFAIPLWFARGYSSVKNSDRHGLKVTLIGVSTAIIQGMLIVSAGKPYETPTAPKPGLMAIAFAQRWGLEYLSVASLLLGLTLFVALLLSPLARRGRWQRLAFLLFAILVMAPVFVKFYRMPELMISRAVGWRYFYIPSVMLLWVAISLFWTLKGISAWIGGLAAALIISGSLSTFVRPPRQIFPDWYEKAHLIGKEPVVIVYSPGWQLDIPK